MSEYLVNEAAGERLDRWLAERSAGRARNQIQHDIEAGRVLVNGAARPARYRVALGDRIEHDPPQTPPSILLPENIPLNIIFEDEQMIVLDKPAGLVVHPAPGHAQGTVANALLAHCGRSLEGVGGEGRWGIVHRLDALTSGLMLAAKTQAAYEALVQALAERRVRRHYLGLVIGTFKENQGTVDRPIGRRKGDRKRMGVLREGGLEARTDWRLLCQGEGLGLLGLTLHSGRTHQIRVHLQSIGHPVLADSDYGWSKPRTMQSMNQELRSRLAVVWPERQMLHAALLMLEHPTAPRCQLRFQSALPDDMTRVMGVVWEESWREPVREWLEQS